MVTHENLSDNSTDDTITAVITPPGEGGIAALRIAGPDSFALLNKHFQPQSESAPEPFLLRYGSFVASSGDAVDEVMAVVMPKGRSYTGLDQVEIFCHGGRAVVRIILKELLESGARSAEPGEFTKLAFLNGRIDLARAEAVAEMIAADTHRSYEASREHLLGAYSSHIEKLREQLVLMLADIEASIDFSEEEIDQTSTARQLETLSGLRKSIDTLLQTYTGGRMIKEGFKIAIAGRPNAGKSSLFNRLLRQERALVNPSPGTTRDYLSEWIDMEGIAVNLVDTAGIRKDAGDIEKQGQERACEIMAESDLVIWMFDVSDAELCDKLESDLERLPSADRLIVANKCDLLEGNPKRRAQKGQPVPLSCLTGDGIDKLRNTIVERINERMPDLTSGLVVTSARHQQKLSIALESIRRTEDLLRNSETPEIVAFELRQAVMALDEITGRVYTEEILGSVFARFCVGK